MTKPLQPAIRFKGFTDAWEHWKLGSLAEINPKSELPDVFEYVDLESVVGTEMVFHREENKSTAPSRAQRLAKHGDLFYQTVRPYQRNNFLFEIRDNNYVFSTGYAQLRPHCDSYFLLCLVQNDLFVKNVLDRCTGTSYPAINSTDLAEMDLKVPRKLVEQQQIGKFFRNLDFTTTLHQRKLDQLNELKRTLLQKMFPKKDEKIPEYRFPGFTDAWEQRKFGELLSEYSEKSKIENQFRLLSSTNSGMEFREGRVSGKSNVGYKVIYFNDLVLSPQNLWLGNININDLEIGIVSPSYKTFKVLTDVNFLKVQLKKTKLLHDYKIASTQGASVVRRNLDIDLFKEIILKQPVDNIEVEWIGKLFIELENIITLHQRKLELLQDLKKTLLQRLFV